MVRLVWTRPAFASSTELAQQGEFIGGHLAAVAGLLTLAIVVYTGFAQSQQQQRFFMRGYFLHGVELIGEAIQRGDQLHAYRLTDYFSRLAKSEDDDELFLILNTFLAMLLLAASGCDRAKTKHAETQPQKPTSFRETMFTSVTPTADGGAYAIGFDSGLWYLRGSQAVKVRFPDLPADAAGYFFRHARDHTFARRRCIRSLHDR